MEENNMCKCKNTITLTGTGCLFEADQEPYQNDVEEDVTEEESCIIDNIALYVSATLCMKCKKVYFWHEDGTKIYEQDI